MHIANLQINHFKSWLSSPTMGLTPGFNVIIGKNNSGKTALAEALSLRFPNSPHRSPITVTDPEALLTTPSSARLSFVVTEAEARNILYSASDNIFVPLAGRRLPEPESESYRQEALDLFTSFISPYCTINCEYSSGGFTDVKLSQLNVGRGDNVLAILFKRDRQTRSFEPTGNPNNVTGDSLFFAPLASVLYTRIYMFNAERRVAGSHYFGQRTELEPDASNLAEVLHSLQTEDEQLYDRYVKLTRRIFPDIGYISVPPLRNDGTPSTVEIRVRSMEVGSRTDLAIPLSQSGTGIGQVLAILYVVLTARYARTIIIDEPQSFLHPGAVLKLIEVLKEFPQHQYVMTTHSPSAIAAADPQTLILVQKKGAESVPQSMKLTEIEDMKTILADVGVRLSDVFGADYILWVEGPTEELCFPLIVRQLTNKPLPGTRILGVLETADFEPQEAEKTIRRYNKLSNATGAVPPAWAYIFDRETRTPEQQNDLNRLGGGRVFFTKRRMYENYLLHAQAIAFVLSEDNQDEHGQPSPVSVEEVESWLAKNRWDEKFMGQYLKDSNRSDEFWRTNVHGAKLLTRLFVKLSGSRVNYEKKQHGLALTKWILENCPEQLEELAELLSNVLSLDPLPD